ncbi:transporter major facilitator family protein [Kutzneria sp. CA-103260]|nr:transporter major facilitator family protein [Kutzneria sp. CA-103260]
MLGDPGFRRLLFCRLASQWADGLFQAGLAGAVLFNPERQADPLAIAGGFAVILIPYSVVGPFAGALLDRWDRRRLLIVANFVRVALVLLTAVADGFGLSNGPLYAAALLVMGASRFIGAGLSAALPHVVESRDLVTGNSMVATLASAAAAIGGATAFGLRDVLGSGNVGSAQVTSVAIVGALVSALFAAQFAAGVLGPDEVDEPHAAFVAVAKGMVDGGRAALRVPSVAAGFIALTAHRIAYGASLLVIVLLMKYTLHSDGVFRAGAGGLTEAVAAGAAGLVLSGVVTPGLVRRLGRPLAVSGALVVAAVGLVALGLPMTVPTLLGAAFVVSFCGQTVKLNVDAAIQRDVPDQSRGRVFSVSDTVFNVAMVLGVTVVATIVPMNGQSPSVVLGTAAVYLIGLVGYVLVLRAHPNSPR